MPSSSRSRVKGRRLDWLVYTLFNVVAYRYKLKVLAAQWKGRALDRGKRAQVAAAAAASSQSAPLREEDRSLPPLEAAGPAGLAGASPAAAAPSGEPPLEERAKGAGPRTPAAARAALEAAWGAAQAAVENAAAAGPAALVAACNALAGCLRSAVAAVEHSAVKSLSLPAPLQRGTISAPSSANPNSLKRVGVPSGGASRKKNVNVSLKGVRPSQDRVHISIARRYFMMAE